MAFYLSAYMVEADTDDIVPILAPKAAELGLSWTATDARLDYRSAEGEALVEVRADPQFDAMARVTRVNASLLRTLGMNVGDVSEVEAGAIMRKRLLIRQFLKGGDPVGIDFSDLTIRLGDLAPKTRATITERLARRGLDVSAQHDDMTAGEAMTLLMGQDF